MTNTALKVDVLSEASDSELRNAATNTQAALQALRDGAARAWTCYHAYQQALGNLRACYANAQALAEELRSVVDAVVVPPTEHPTAAEPPVALRALRVREGAEVPTATASTLGDR